MKKKTKSVHPDRLISMFVFFHLQGSATEKKNDWKQKQSWKQQVWRDHWGCWVVEIWTEEKDARWSVLNMVSRRSLRIWYYGCHHLDWLWMNCRHHWSENDVMTRRLTVCKEISLQPRMANVRWSFTCYYVESFDQYSSVYPKVMYCHWDPLLSVSQSISGITVRQDERRYLYGILCEREIWRSGFHNGWDYRRRFPPRRRWSRNIRKGRGARTRVTNVDLKACSSFFRRR